MTRGQMYHLLDFPFGGHIHKYLNPPYPRISSDNAIGQNGPEEFEAEKKRRTQDKLVWLQTRTSIPTAIAATTTAPEGRHIVWWPSSPSFIWSSCQLSHTSFHTYIYWHTARCIVSPEQRSSILLLSQHQIHLEATSPKDP